MARWTPFPPIGGAYSDDTKPWSAQDCLNYIPVPAEREGTRSSGKLVGVPGMTTITASMQEAPVRGLHDVEGALLAVTGNKLYRIGNDGAATGIGIVPGVGMVSMAHNQVQYGHEVMIANGQSGYVYNTYTGEFGQVSDDGFPGFKVVDFIDGYIAGIEPQGRFWAHSNLRDAKDYNTLDRYDAESAPDKMVSLIVSHREVMILNQRSASFFRNVGTATGTFQNSNGTELEVGGASTFAVARLDNTVYWLGNDGIVYRLAGHSPQRVSTGPIEQAIARCDISKAFAFTFEDRGHKVFYLTFPDGQTWGFDVWTNEWHRRASENLNRWRINALVKWRGKWIAGDFSNGRLYQLDWAVQHEAGGVLERRRTLGVLHDNQNRVIVNGAELVVDTGLASPSSPAVPAEIIYAWEEQPNWYQYVANSGPRAVNGIAFQLSGTSEGLIYSSSDWESWTAHNTGATYALYGLAHGLAGGNDYYNVVGYGGGIRGSFDLTTWDTSVGTNGQFSSTLNDAVRAGGNLISVGNGGRVVRGSGAPFFPTTKDLKGVAANSERYVAVGSDGTIITAFLADSLKWSVVTTGVGDLGFAHAFVDVLHDGSRFVAVGYGTASPNKMPVVSVSTDGLTWASSVAGAIPVHYMSGIAYDGNRYVITGKAAALSDGAATSDSTNAIAYASDNAESWFVTYSNAPGPLGSIAFAAGRFGVLVGSGGSGTPYSYLSYTGAAAAVDDSRAATLDLRYSKDGGRNWSDWKQRSLGEVGDFVKRVAFRRLGQGRQWVFDIRVTDPVRADLIAASLQIEGEG